MKRYVKPAAWPYNTKYQIRWISPDGKNCLLGGSNTIEGANRIAQNQAWELFDNPWESNDRKLKFLDSLYVVDVKTEEDAMSYETEEYIDNLMSELDSRLNMR